MLRLPALLFEECGKENAFGKSRQTGTNFFTILKQQGILNKGHQIKIEKHTLKETNEYNISVFTALTEKSGDLALMFEHPLRINPICRVRTKK